MINLVWSGLLALLLLSGCGWNGTPSRVNDFVPLTSIVIVAESPAIEASHTIAAKTSTKLTVKGNFSGLFTRDITDQATWSSDTPAVAGFVTAASPNRVTGIAPGSATLTATVKGISATYTLHVSSATVNTPLTISPAAPSIVKGLTTQFTVSGTFSDNTTQDLTFDAAWLSSAPGVATVSDAAGSKGFAQALVAGTTTISATFGGVSGSTLLTVTEPVLQSITITPDSPSLLSLSTSTLSFQATGHYSNGSTADITSQAVWASSDPGVATIAATGGAVTTLAKGTTTSISATLNGVSGDTKLNVTGGDLTGFTVSPAPLTLVKGTVARMTVKGIFDNGSSRDITGFVNVKWTPADPTLATVTAPGGNLAWLNALAATIAPTIITTQVTAKSGTQTATTSLTVTAPTLQTLVIIPTSQSLFAGISTRFTATATFSDNSTQDVTASTTWTSSNGNIATVGDSGINKGLVKGVSTGNTLINATFAGVPASSINVNVTAPILQAPVITVSGGIAQGTQVKFTATANGQDVTEDTTWLIDNTNVAILADSTNQPGQVVGVFKGTTTLRATFGGNTATTSIIVQ